MQRHQLIPFHTFCHIVATYYLFNNLYILEVWWRVFLNLLQSILTWKHGRCICTINHRQYPYLKSNSLLFRSGYFPNRKPFSLSYTNSLFKNIKIRFLLFSTSWVWFKIEFFLPNLKEGHFLCLYCYVHISCMLY